MFTPSLVHVCLVSTFAWPRNSEFGTSLVAGCVMCELKGHSAKLSLRNCLIPIGTRKFDNNPVGMEYILITWDGFERQEEC